MIRAASKKERFMTTINYSKSRTIVTKLSFTAVLALFLIGVLDPSLLSAEDNTFIKNQVANE